MASDPISATAGGLFDIGVSAFNSAQAQKADARNRRWQERMSSTAHQREAKDLELAGLNRILGMSGSGASSPSGGSTTIPASNPISSAISAMRAREELGLLRDQRAKAKAETRLTNASATKQETTVPLEKMKNQVLTDVLGEVNNVYSSAKSIAKKNFSDFKKDPVRTSKREFKKGNNAATENTRSGFKRIWKGLKQGWNELTN